MNSSAIGGRALNRVPDRDHKTEARATWGACPAGTTFGGGAEPGTREFFDRVVEKRTNYEQPWLTEVVPFASFQGRRVLEVGCGAGYDALTFCRSGADYTGLDLTPENVERAFTHLGFYGFHPTIVQGDGEQLPFADESFDVVYSNGVLHHTPDMEAAFREVSRVLVPGGGFWVLVYNKHSIFHLVTLYLFTYVLSGRWRRDTMADVRSDIEYTTGEARPLVNVYSRGEVKRLLRRAGMQVERTWVRKLTREDLPAPARLGWLWRATPRAVLDAVGRVAGWYVIAHATKT